MVEGARVRGNRVGAVALAAALAAVLQAQPAAAGLPAEGSCQGCNLVIVSIDTLRPDRLEPFGYDRPTSPYLAKLAARGIKDMVRISDARMSGTAFGTIVLHTTPEAYVGGPLALVESGDRITLDVERRLLQLEIGDEVLEQRRQRWQPPAAHPGSDRGYLRLFMHSVQQADSGCDFDFM